MASKTGNKLPVNLPQLQNLIKRDSQSYREEFLQQYRHYESNLEIFQLNPTQFNKSLSDLLMFLAQVAHCYKEELSEYPQQLVSVLKRFSTQLDQEMRFNMCKALILLRNKRFIEPLTMLELFFELFRCQDKSLRKFLCSYIVTDIKNINKKQKDPKLNRGLQNFMYSMLRDNNVTAARMSLEVMIDLYRRNLWNDARTVNVIANTALFSRVTKLAVNSLKFFVGRDGEGDDDDSDEEDAAEQRKDTQETIDHLRLSNKVGKHSKKKDKKIKLATQQLKKKKKKTKAEGYNFSALHLLHDPQDLSEKLFKHLETVREKLDVKLLYLNLISRLIGIHECLLINFYPYLQRFLKPHQREVTRILLYTAQASHALVPPDILEPVLMTIANNFISDRNSSEVMTVGLNSVREISARCPLSMTDTLLQDLALYKNHKDKGVNMAARSLISLFRQINPELLHKKDRGRPVDREVNPASREFAALNSKDHIFGAEVLDTEVAENEEKNEEDGWESASDISDDSDGEWIDIPHSSDEDVQVEAEKLASMTADERLEKARTVTQSRILTQDEHDAIKRAGIAAAHNLKSDPKGNTKKTAGQKRRAESQTDPDQHGEVLPMSAIVFTHKRKKQTKQEKTALAMEGKMDRSKYGHTAHNPEAGVTNKVKSKAKSFQMVKHKINRVKGKRSFREKQMALQKSLVRRTKHHK